MLKVLSYWNLNVLYSEFERELIELKVLSYWNLNNINIEFKNLATTA